jgi:hypothetical protein
VPGEAAVKILLIDNIIYFKLDRHRFAVGYGNTGGGGHQLK